MENKLEGRLWGGKVGGVQAEMPEFITYPLPSSDKPYTSDIGNVLLPSLAIHLQAILYS